MASPEYRMTYKLETVAQWRRRAARRWTTRIAVGLVLVGALFVPDVDTRGGEHVVVTAAEVLTG